MNDNNKVPSSGSKLTLLEYTAIVEQAPILIWRSGEDAKCNYFNEQWLAFRGKTMEEENGDGWVKGVHPDDLKECVDIYLSSFKKRKVFEMEYRLMRSDGEYRWIFDRGVPFYSEEGEFLGYIGSCIDINDAKNAREKFKAMQQTEIVKLRDLVPMCSKCKKVRDDKGYWEEVEGYIKKKHLNTILHTDYALTVTKLLVMK